MESVLATSIIRETAQLITRGVDPDQALRECSRGASKQVRDLVIAYIVKHSSGKKADVRAAKAAILAAARDL